MPDTRKQYDNHYLDLQGVKRRAQWCKEAVPFPPPRIFCGDCHKLTQPHLHCDRCGCS